MLLKWSVIYLSLMFHLSNRYLITSAMMEPIKTLVIIS